MARFDRKCMLNWDLRKPYVVYINNVPAIEVRARTQEDAMVIARKMFPTYEIKVVFNEAGL